MPTRTAQLILLSAVAVAAACHADRAADPGAPPPSVSASYIKDISGICAWGGDDFHDDAVWSGYSGCTTITVFTGQTFNINLVDSLPSAWYDTTDNRLVYWIDAHLIDTTYYGDVLDILRGTATSSYPASVSASATLEAHLGAVLFIGYAGACPRASGFTDQECADWALENSHAHDEPTFCVSNPLFETILFTQCVTDLLRERPLAGLFRPVTGERS